MINIIYSIIHFYAESKQVIEIHLISAKSCMDRDVRASWMMKKI